jgi:hypothetical protein
MFSYQNTVTEQQTVHDEGNQYTCDVCKKSFALCTTFRSHWHTHKQESQYSCNVCVISHSMIRVIWRNINAYILESVRSLALCVISSTLLRVIWRNMISCTVMCVHIAVLCVIKGLFLRVIWRSITSLCMVKVISLNVMFVTNHSPFCLILKNINCYTVKTADITVRHCNVSFVWLRNLKVHLLKHINEYPYPCDLCGKGFSCQSGP